MGVVGGRGGCGGRQGNGGGNQGGAEQCFHIDFLVSAAFRLPSGGRLSQRV